MKSTTCIQMIPPRSTVEVQLPDGRILTGPRGATVAQFLQAAMRPGDAPLVAAIVNDELRELTYSIDMDARVQPITLGETDGSRIYRRSLTLLLEMAFSDLFPASKLTIDHSVAFGGYYCQVSGRDPLGQAELEQLKQRLQEFIDADLPFERLELPLAEAVEYFRSRGYEDKVHLFAYRRKPYVTLYRLGERMDYHHGYMVPSTGYLRWYDLYPTNGGFTLRFPRHDAPTQLLPVPEYPKLLNAFRQYGDWLRRLGIDNVGALNDAIHAGRGSEVVLVSEAFHEQNLSDIARQVADHRDQIRLVLISGPSSSGKTTFSRRLTVQMLALGISPFPLELDNYFLDRDQTPPGPDGKPNFEALEALDLDLLADQLQALIRGEQVHLPHFNFKTGKREAGDLIQLKRGQLIILEGIHGLNPRLIPAALADKVFRIYVSALTQLNLDRHNRVSTTDTRLVRRIVRDARERGYSAAQTISRWESVRDGEKNYIFPYQENADAMFNSALVYEMAALKPLAEPLLRQVQHGTPEYIEAKRLLAFLEWFLPLEVDLIPETSILREFMGGSILKDFKVWK
ncbi:MAG: nucleoside kinase [Chloroflexota bacterium]